MTTAAIAASHDSSETLDELYRTEFTRVVSIARRILAHHAEAEVRRYADPLLIMPFPVRADRERAANVVVQGVAGIAVSTLFGLSTIVVWQKDGMVYAVGGTYPRERVLAIANSLR